MNNKKSNAIILFLFITSLMYFVAFPGQTMAALGIEVWEKKINDSGSYDFANSLIVDSSALYVGGWNSQYGYPDTQWSFKKLNISDGNIIGQFNKNYSNQYDIINNITTDLSGIYFAGLDSSLFTSPTQTGFSVAKYALDGSTKIWEKNFRFGAGPGNDKAIRTITDSSSTYFIGFNNYGWPGGNGAPGTWYVEKRNLNNGSLQQSAFYSFGSGSAEPYAIAMESDYLYITGTRCQNIYPPSGCVVYVDCEGRIEKRAKADLSLIWEKNYNPNNTPCVNSTEGISNVFADSTGVYYTFNGKVTKMRLDGGGVIWDKAGLSLMFGVDKPTGSVLYTRGAPKKIFRINSSDGTVIDSFSRQNEHGTYLLRDAKADAAESFIYTAGVDYSLGANNTQWIVKKIALKNQCSDGIDNDGDTRIDWNADVNLTDPGCTDPNDDDESNDPECFDRIDNADPEDSLIDMADPGCVDIFDNDETDPPCSPNNCEDSICPSETCDNGCGVLVPGEMLNLSNSCKAETNGQTFPTAPTINLCSLGNIPPLTDFGSGWSWTCSGQCAGSSANCSANKATRPPYIEVEP